MCVCVCVVCCVLCVVCVCVCCVLCVLCVCVCVVCCVCVSVLCVVCVDEALHGFPLNGAQLTAYRNNGNLGAIHNHAGALTL